MRLTNRWRTGGLALLIGMLCAAPLLACSVPVFRYALERWRSDNYEIVIFHRGELPEDLQRIADDFEPLSLDGNEITNVAVFTVDLDDDPDEDTLELWESQQTDTLPWMIVRYPQVVQHQTAPAVWSGPADIEAFDRLVDSPLRTEIARRLLKGGTGVWVLLESGKQAEDDAAFEFLNRQLEYLETELALPEIDQQDVLDGLVSIDPSALEISFSAVRLKRDDPQEQMLIEMLLGSEADLREFDSPMAFPVFGRGRVLYALVGDGINGDTLHEACSTLVGPCTCQVKDQNPGIDLVTSIAWDELIEPQVEIDKELPPLQGLGGFAEVAEPQTAADDSLALAGTQHSAPPEESPSIEDETIEDETEAVVTDEAVASQETTASQAGPTPPSPAPVGEGMNAVLRNTLIVLGVCVIAIVGVSLVLATRKGS